MIDRIATLEKIAATPMPKCDSVVSDAVQTGMRLAAIATLHWLRGEIGNETYVKMMTEK